MTRPAVITQDCQAFAWSELDQRTKPPAISLTKNQPLRFLHLCADQDGLLGYSLCLTPSGQTVVVPSYCLELTML
jgi:hypothetical protein